MKKALFTAVLFTAFILISAPVRAELANAEKGRIGIEASLWWPQVTGETSFDTDMIEGTTLDVVDVFDIDKTTMNIELNVWLNVTKRNRLSFAWFMDQRSGSGKLEKSVTIAGKEYVAGFEIKGDIEMQRYKFLYERAILRNDLGRLAIGTGISVHDTIAQVEGVALAGILEIDDSVQKRVTFALPVIALAGEIHLPLGFGVFAEGCGMGMKYDFVSAMYYDIRGGVNWKSRFVFAQAGYHYLVVEGKAYDKLDVEYSLIGPFASLGAKF